MAWMPNASAAIFLAREVLPQLRARFPDARLRVVGRDPGPDVRALAQSPGVEVTGAVPDVLPHLQEAHMLAVPLETGGGTRLKILEAFAAGLPVVSTAVGCEGISAVPNEHLVVAARDEMARAIADVLENEAATLAMARRARELVLERYDWSAVGLRAESAIQAAHARVDRQPFPVV